MVKSGCCYKKDELMLNKKHFVVFYFSLCTVEIVDASNLLSLLQTSTVKSKVDVKSAKNLSTMLQKSVTKFSDIQKPVSLKPSSVKVSLSNGVKKKSDNTLLQNVEQVQNNSDYQTALTILSDQEMRKDYHNDMMSIQLFLLDYISQILQKYSVQAKKAQKSISLTDLLEKIAPESSVDGQHQLSKLTNLLQKKSLVTTSGVAQHVDLDQLIQKNVAIIVAPIEPKANLGKLLTTSVKQATSLVVNPAKKQPDLTSLLKEV